MNLSSEIRCDFEVTTERKKIWKAELDILQNIARVCRKYGITYYVDFGTLLGAIRHKGFIPWDDDIDICMFRSDYMRFQEIAPKEFTHPYFFQSTYNDLMLYPFCKVRNSLTTAIEYPDMNPSYNQGIFVDIFAIDVARDGSQLMDTVYNYAYDLWRILGNKQTVERLLALDENAVKSSFIIELDIIRDLVSLSERDIFRQFENLLLDYSDQSEEVCHWSSEMSNRPHLKTNWFGNPNTVPFEDITVPIPQKYSDILDKEFGNWHEFIKGGSDHQGIFFDPDTPYLEHMKK